MEGRVDVALALGLARGSPRRSARSDVPLLLQRERQDRGVAAGRGRARCRRRSRRPCTMPGPDGWAMWTWLSMPPGRTRRPAASISRRRALDLLGDCRDPAVADADIGAKRVRGGDHRAAADGEIEFRHRALRALSSVREAAGNGGVVLRGIEHNRFTPGRRTFKPVAHSSHRATASSSKHCDRAHGRAAALVDLAAAGPGSRTRPCRGAASRLQSHS